MDLLLKKQSIENVISNNEDALLQKKTYSAPLLTCLSSEINGGAATGVPENTSGPGAIDHS